MKILSLLRISGGAGTESFTPDRVSGMQRWFDFSDVALLTLDGSNKVSQVLDKGPYHSSATQSTGAKQPDYVAASQNGLGIVRIANTQNGPVLDLGTDVLITPSAGFCFFIAFKVNAFATEPVPYIGNFQTNAGTAYGIITEKFNGRLNAGGTGLAQIKSDVAAFTFTNFNVLTIQGVGGTVSDAANYRLFSGATELTVSSGGIAGGWVQANSYLGKGRYIDGVWYESADYDIGELIIYSGAMSDADRNSVINYLRSKWAAA